MTDEDQPIRGQVPTPQELQELDSLRKLFDPQAAIDRLETYGKWLFGSTTVIAGFGAGLSNTSLSKLRGPGILMFAAAMAALGLCLVFASFSIAPQWAQVNLSSIDSMLGAFNQQIGSRRRVITVSAAACAFALFLAALSPLASLAAKVSPPVVNCTISDKGDLDATIEASDQPVGTLASLRLETTGVTQTVLGIGQAKTDDSGHIKAEIKKSGVTSVPGGVDLVACLGKQGESPCPGEQRFHIK